MQAHTVERLVTHVALKGWGYDYGQANFDRLSEDTAVSIALDEYAKPHHAIVYRVSDGRRMHITIKALREVHDEH